MQIESKVCTACHQDKPLKQFWPKKTGKYGRYSQCIPCCANKKSAYRAKHKEVYRRKNREWARKLRLEVLNAYGHKCACCGETAYEFLALDHKNNDGAEERRKHGESGKIYMKAKREGFPKDRYQLLCHNCNQAKGYYGYCPHVQNESRVNTVSGRTTPPQRRNRRKYYRRKAGRSR